jgi:hypothetical protein
MFALNSEEIFGIAKSTAVKSKFPKNIRKLIQIKTTHFLDIVVIPIV